MESRPTLVDDEIVTRRRLARRDIVVLGALGAGPASVLALVGATGCCFGRLPGNGCSDRDPADRVGHGVHCVTTGCSDRDPSDPMNGGRNCVASGCTDRDPVDAVGAGHNCTRSAPAPGTPPEPATAPATPAAPSAPASPLPGTTT